jgi:geranylgeranyl pyrophosphate synthase
MELGSIFAPVAEEMKCVDEKLRALMHGVVRQAGGRRWKIGILDRIVEHPFAVPGKRIRPALVLLAARATSASGKTDGDDLPQLITVASAVEVLHAASLVHDDVIDGADARRHQVSLNKRFGNRVAVLAGDILYTHFFSLITGLAGVAPSTRFAVLDLFLETTKAMCMGEILAQEAVAAVPRGNGGASPRGVLSFSDYKEIATDKTAVLFAACCRSAGLLSGATEMEQRRLAEFGLHFGLTFQMADDLVDNDHGLDPSVDLRAATLEYAEKARSQIALFDESPYRASLRDLIDFVIAQAIS